MRHLNKTALIEISAVAEIKMLRFIVEIIRRAPPFLHREVQIFLIAGGGVKPHPRRRPHEERIAPRPQLARLGIFFLGKIQSVGR